MSHAAHAVRRRHRGIMIIAVLCFAMARAAIAAPPPRPREGLSIDLGGQWRVQPAALPQDGPVSPPAPEVWGTMLVPGQAARLKPGQGDVWKGIDTRKLDGVWLERDVTVPGGWKGKRIILRGELIEQSVSVHVDGARAGSFEPPGDGLDLTAALKPGAAQVLRFLIARGEETLTRVPEHVVGPVGPLGIAGSIRLDAIAPRVAIDDVFLMPSVRKKRLNARVRFHTIGAEKRISLHATVTEMDGTPVRRFDTTLSAEAGESFHDVSFPWRDPILWELDRPHLYRITIAALDRDGKPLDAWGPETFGYREFRLDGKEMLLNEHPCRLRLLWHWGVAENNLAFFQGIGFNAIAIQPRDGRWFSGWGANGDIDALVGSTDRRGVGLVATGKVINGIEHDDPRIRSYFRRASFTRIWRYANHPSILAWNISLNVGNSHEEWMPLSIGREPEGDRANHRVTVAADIVDKLDPTRSVMAHAGGNIAPITSANVYLNFVPLQEREEWLSDWARNGTRPFAAIEFGPPYSANFFRRCVFGDPMFTEYCAIYLGDEAYVQEQTAYVEQVENLTVTNAAGHGSKSIYERGGDKRPLQRYAAENTAFFPVVSEFVRRTNRAWRAFGHNVGSHPWMWNIGFGGEPSGPMNAFFYTHLAGSDTQLRQRPEWADAYYDAYRDTMQPLLVFVGGRRKRITERDHVFFPDETVEKQIIAVWDGGWPTEIVVRWGVYVDKRIAGDALRLELEPGEIRKVPIKFRTPANGAGHGKITLVVEDTQGKELGSDSFVFDVIHRPKLEISASRDDLLWDPEGDSRRWIRKLGVRPASWKPGKPLPPGSTLIIGRNALSDAQRLPFTRADLDDGLRVLVLEQQPGALERFGFRVAQTFSRRLFPRDSDHPILRNIGRESLEDWRGSATLLPEYIPLDDFNPVRPRCAHWGNYGVVASALIETPHHGNFTPIVDGEFDMRYSPLLEWTCGNGRVIFSQFDFTGRVGVDPAATHLARNLLWYMLTATVPVSRSATYVGGPKGRALVSRLGLDVDLDASPDRLPERGLLIAGEGVKGSQLDAQKLVAFTQSGGYIVALPRPAEEFRTGWLPLAVKTERRNAHRAGTGSITPPPIRHVHLNDAVPPPDEYREMLNDPLRALGPADFHWRDIAEFEVFAGNDSSNDGFFLQLSSAGMPGEGTGPGGGWILCQADPAAFENTGTVSLRAEWPAPGWSDQPDRMVDVPKPWLRPSLQRMDRMYSQILANLGAGPSDALAERVLSFIPPPRFRPPKTWQVAATKEKDDKWLPAEWRTMAGAMKLGFAGTLDFDAGTAHARTMITADRASDVPMRVRFGWGVKTADILLNGKSVFALRKNQWCPRPGNEIILPLRPGENELLVKMVGKFDVQLAVREIPDRRLDGNEDILYRDPARLGDDPYAWFAW